MTQRCRFCAAPLTQVVVDLGLSPVSNHFRDAATIDRVGQGFYPLKTMVCDQCRLVQLTDVDTPPHFTEDYVYFSSNSSSWLAHAEAFAKCSIARFGLNEQTMVVELASNDGYLLQYFKRAGVRVLGIDPTANTADEARRSHGIETLVNFFSRELGERLAQDGVCAELVVGNNVLAHVPDPNDFLGGIPHILARSGTLTLEFPHLLQMLELCQFDTIYHEHYSYLSLLCVERMLGAHGLAVYGVEEIATHGGSLRIYAGHAENATSRFGDAELAAGLAKVRADEAAARLDEAPTYENFGQRVAAAKFALLDFLIDARRSGRRVLGYGAPAKGNTLLNYCGVGPELLEYTVDVSQHKRGRYLPGVNIPVRGLDDLIDDRPDYVLILPWNLKDEIVDQLAGVREWGGQFVVPIPQLMVI